MVQSGLGSNFLGDYMSIGALNEPPEKLGTQVIGFHGWGTSW
jgi:hypothetical protein